MDLNLNKDNSFAITRKQLISLTFKIEFTLLVKTLGHKLGLNGSPSFEKKLRKRGMGVVVELGTLHRGLSDTAHGEEP